MNYPTDQLNKDCLAYVQSLADLRTRKGADYARPDDTFSDLRVLGVDYCLKRIIQKCFRALNLLTKEPAVTEDKLEDEFKDITNFAIYCHILYEQEKK